MIENRARPAAFWRRRIKILLLLAAGVFLLVIGLVAFAILRAARSEAFEPRFARSRAALDAFAAIVMAAKDGPFPAVPERIGEFRPGKKIVRLPHGFLIYCDYGHPLDANGIAYSTQPLPESLPAPKEFPESQSRYYFWLVDGPWYRFSVY